MTVPALLRKWEDWLLGKDCNSIGNQIFTLENDFAYLSLIAHAIDSAPEDANGAKELNAMFFNTSVRVYFTALSISIRKQLLSSGDESTLAAILAGLAHNLRLFDLFTLTNYLQERASARGGSFESDRYLASVQQVFETDGTTGLQRLSPRLHRELMKLLRECEEISKHATAFYAHAITVEERRKRYTESITATLLELKRAICLLAMTYRTLCLVLLDSAVEVHPILPPNHADYLTSSLIQVGAEEGALQAMSSAYDLVSQHCIKVTGLLATDWRTESLLADLPQ